MEVIATTPTEALLALGSQIARGTHYPSHPLHEATFALLHAIDAYAQAVESLALAAETN